MLIELTVANYRSIKEPQTLSLVATKAVAKDKQLDADNTFEMDGVKLLKSVAIYGANSSGKSNLIKAIRFARRFVTRFRARRDSDVNEPIQVEPFLLDSTSTTQPSSFEFVFFAGDRQYRYGFEATPERVVSEWLYHVPQRREAMLFTRDGDAYDLQGAFKSEGAGLESKTRENRLFLSVVAEFNGAIARTVVDWFARLRVDSGLADRDRSLTEQMLDTERASPEQREKVLEVLRRLNLGFDDVVVKHDRDEVADAIIRQSGQIDESSQDETSRRISSRQQWLYMPARASAHTVHRKNDTGETVLFDLDDQESDGTQRVFALAGKLVDVLAQGQVMIVDEMDARLHPILTRNMVQLFNSRQTNPKNAQLVFATHDTNLLTNHLFRRDQIWFVEKDQHQASQLYSLVEFKGVRNDASFEKDYILGRYGAIPFLGDFRDLLSPSDRDNLGVKEDSASDNGE
ncbi:MAG: ATP-binding protein [Chloroflexi bacterium]|nr:ATP-binding protein [Chloroflexota bacterium]